MKIKDIATPVNYVSLMAEQTYSMCPYLHLTLTPTPHLGWLSIQRNTYRPNLLVFFYTLSPVPLVGFNFAAHAILQVASYQPLILQIHILHKKLLIILLFFLALIWVPVYTDGWLMSEITTCSWFSCFCDLFLLPPNQTQMYFLQRERKYVHYYMMIMTNSKSNCYGYFSL